MHPMLTIARRAAEEAGKIIQRGYRDIERIQVHEKGRGDLVSAVDQRAEKAIRMVLEEKYPDFDIVGEEFGHEQKNAEASEIQWIIDPLDGTANFLHGLPQFSVSIAAVKNGKPEVGIVYNPISDDWFTAARGQGAQLNGSKIRVNKQRNPENAIIGTGFPYKSPELLPLHLRRVSAILQDFGDLRRLGSAALDLCYVACGRQDAYFEGNLYSWDMAAGILIAQEAGAIVTDYQGNDEMLEKGTVICSNNLLYTQLYQLIKNTK